MAEAIGHLRKRTVGQRVFQRRRTAVMRIDVHALGRERAVVDHVALVQIGRVAGAASHARVQRRRAERVAAQRIPGLRFTALERAEAPQIDHERRNRIAGHDVGLEIGIAPARQPTALLVDRQQGTADVTRHVRAGQCQPLVLRAVGIPQREVLVVGPAVGTVDAIVIATVAAVGVVAGHRLEQRVVDRAVEHRAVVGVAALHTHPAQLLTPRLLGQRTHAVETEQRSTLHAICAQIDARAFGIHVRDCADRRHRLALGQVEGQPAPFGFCSPSMLCRAPGRPPPSPQVPCALNGRSNSMRNQVVY